LPGYGDVLRLPELAESYRRVAREGEALFYQGDLARAAVDASARAGGLFTLADFAGHRTEVTAPLAGSYRGYQVFVPPPVSQAYMILQMLALLEGFDLAALGAGSAEALHLMVEAKRLAYADRLRHMGDPNFVPFRAEQLLDPAYIAMQRALIRTDRLILPNELESVPSEQGDTSAFCLVDQAGNAVSFIHSLAFKFGSAEVIPGTGIIMNNRAGRGFVLDPGHPNEMAPGKRTMHTLTCFMALREGKLCLLGGTPGGDGQPQWNLQMITNVLDFGLTPQQAVEAPRWMSHPGTDAKDLGDPLELQVE
jgi:gamma-glutamyltranspeptidase/glutathione hydrolase